MQRCFYNTKNHYFISILMNIKDVLNQYPKYFDSYSPMLSHQEALSILVHLWKDISIQEKETQEIKTWANSLHISVREAVAKRLSDYLPEFLRLGFIIFDDTLLNYDLEKLPTRTFEGYWSVLSYLNTKGNLLPISIELKDIFAFLVRKSKPYQINLQKQNFSDANIAFWDLENADLSDAKFNRCKFLKCNIKKSKMTNTFFTKAHILESDFAGANAKNAKFDFCKTSNFSMFQSNLEDAIWNEADLTGAYLVECNLAKNDFLKCELTMADLQDCNATQSRWSFARLCKTDLHNCNLNESNFYQAMIDETDFTDSKLYDIQFDVISAKGAILTGSFMSNQTLNTWILKGAIKK